jgi:hypothetical protein
MLGGIDNHLFLSGFGGFFVVLLILIPLLIWAFPNGKKDKAHAKMVRDITKELRKIKKK